MFGMNRMHHGRKNKRAFITKWRALFPSSTKTLPLENGNDYDFIVNYGDDTGNFKVDAWNDNNASHTYEDAGEYIVTINGLCTIFTFDDAGDKTSILEIMQWGDVGFESLYAAFYGCTDMETTATDALRLYGLTDLKFLFYNAELANPDVSDWDLRNITDVYYAFSHTGSEDLDVSRWQVGNVVDMSSLFSNIPQLYDPGVENWDTSSVEDMRYMFQNAEFSPAVENWDTGAVTSFRGMFNGAAANPDVSGWDVESATDVQYLFLNSQFSNANYDKLLLSWSQQSLQHDLYFDAGQAKYTESAARAILTDTYNWHITDGGAL